MIRVVLVDDHPLLRTGVAAVLATFPDLDVVGTTGRPDDVATLVADTAPDVVLLDLHLGRQDGGELIPSLVGSARVLVFTASGTDVAITRALAAGTAVFSHVVADRLLDRVRRPDETLTPREGEVLELLGGGASNRAIAERLFLSESTVKTHLARVFAKLGVETRAAAVAEATRRGVIGLR